MRIIRIEDATLEWLEAFYAKYSAAHMERSIKEAQKYFIGDALGIMIQRVVLQPHYVQIESNDEIGAQSLRLLIDTQIVFEGKTFAFGSIMAEIESSFPDGETPDRWLEISFRPI